MDASRLDIRRTPSKRSCMSSLATHHPNTNQDAIDLITPTLDATLQSRSRPQHEEALLQKEQLDPTHDERPMLRYRRRTFWILVFYVPLLVLPWVFTCILAVHRIGGGSYVTQSGLSTKALRDLTRWISAANVLGSINGVATIPLMSALIAQAAVVYGQRRKLNQKLNLRQTIALADRGWSDIGILWDARDTGASCRFLWLAFAFISISAIQQPLQSLLIGNVPVAIVRCTDAPRGRCSSFGPSLIGHDPEPMHMAGVPQNTVVQAVAADISSRSEYSVDPYMWAERLNSDDTLMRDTEPYLTQTPFYYGERLTGANGTFFAAALPNGTSTGVIRQHAIRFNSTIKCEKIPASQFPSECPGVRPLVAQFLRPKQLDLKVCVPGQYGVHPWSLSRNRQDIKEEIFFNVSATRLTIGSTSTTPNFTLHCTTSTTRGYFELGNWYNAYSYGPLKATWPSPQEMIEEFNDFRGVSGNYARPTVEDQPSKFDNLNNLIWQPTLDRFGTRKLNASGPLMNSAIAIFGNGSFFYTAANASIDSTSTASQICSQNSIPFTRLGLQIFDDFQGLCSSSTIDWSIRNANQSDSYLVRIMAGWAYGWNATDKAEQALSLSVFAANKAMLTKTVEASFSMNARPLYTSPGLIVSRPSKSLPATIVISVLILIQLVGIAYLTWYIYHMPSWSHALDALAMVRIGAGVRDAGYDLPPIRSLEEKDLVGLVKVDGLVGLAKSFDEHSQLHGEYHERLVLGGPGLVTRDLSGFRSEKGFIKR